MQYQKQKIKNLNKYLPTYIDLENQKGQKNQCFLIQISSWCSHSAQNFLNFWEHWVWNMFLNCTASTYTREFLSDISKTLLQPKQ